MHQFDFADFWCQDRNPRGQSEIRLHSPDTTANVLPFDELGSNKRNRDPVCIQGRWNIHREYLCHGHFLRQPKRCQTFQQREWNQSRNVQLLSKYDDAVDRYAAKRNSNLYRREHHGYRQRFRDGQLLEQCFYGHLRNSLHNCVSTEFHVSDAHDTFLRHDGERSLYHRTPADVDVIRNRANCAAAAGLNSSSAAVKYKKSARAANFCGSLTKSVSAKVFQTAILTRLLSSSARISA